VQVEKERAEQYLDVAASIIVAFDTRGRVSRFNRKGCEVTGYTEAELVGKNWFDTIVELEDRAEARAAFDSLVRNGGSTTSATNYIETAIATSDGGRRVIGWNLSSINDAQGNVTGVLGSGEDLTERREIEQQLLQAQKMRAVGELTGGLAHDFNNLLMAVQGNIEFLQESLEENSPAAKYCEAALKAVGRGADLTQRLLAFSRKQLLRPEPVSINQLVEDMTELLTRTLGTNIEIDAALGEDVSRAMVDVAQLENALLNLALNARDAMPGGGRLRIESANRSIEMGYDGQKVVLEPGPYVMIAVHDTGTGMPPELLDRVFEPFFTTKEASRGSGLGLSMVYGFVKQSGGHIEIKSKLGQGTSVYLYLPSARDDGIETQADTAAMVPVRGGSEKILVVEDDLAVLDVIVNLLVSLGYNVSQAEHGKAAKALMRSGLRPDLLLTDIIQPQGINGIDLARDTVKYDDHCGILLMSGFTESTPDAEPGQIARFPLLRKPFGKNELARKVREVLDAKQQLQSEPATAPTATA
jgi:PAS domain S-box-containing protein